MTNETIESTEEALNDKQRPIDAWLNEYTIYHLNPTNKLIHWVCVPFIMVSLLGLLWVVPMPAAVSEVSEWINPAMLLVVVAILFYLRLSLPLTIGMAVIAGSALLGIRQLEMQNPSVVWKLCVAVFVVAWIGQFIGHKIEGKKPAFFKDVQFLLVGPIWLLSFIYQRVGIKY